MERARSRGAGGKQMARSVCHESAPQQQASSLPSTPAHVHGVRCAMRRPGGGHRCVGGKYTGAAEGRRFGGRVRTASGGVSYMVRRRGAGSRALQYGAGAGRRGGGGLEGREKRAMEGAVTVTGQSLKHSAGTTLDTLTLSSDNLVFMHMVRPLLGVNLLGQMRGQMKPGSIQVH